MRCLLVFVAFSGGVAMAGCAGTTGQEGVVAVDAPSPRRSTRRSVEVTEVVQPVDVDAAKAPNRPRLAQTVTLGQGAAEPSYTATIPQQAQGNERGNVVVNNTITVVGSPAVYGGYSYGYGGYGSGGASAGSRDYGRGTSTGSPSGAWAPSGWEGAGRTAAPGHTPGVGGNWAPAASHGPRSLK